MLCSRYYSTINIARVIRLVSFLFFLEPLSIWGWLRGPNVMLLIISTGIATFLRDLAELVNLQRSRSNPLPSSASIIIEALFTIEALSVVVYLAYGGFIDDSDYAILVFYAAPLPINAILSVFILYRTVLIYQRDQQHAREFEPSIVFTSTGEPVMVLKRTQAAFNPAFNASIDSLLQSPNESYVMETFQD